MPKCSPGLGSGVAAQTQLADLMATTETDSAPVTSIARECLVVSTFTSLPDALAHPVDGTACLPGEALQIAVDMAIPLVRTSTGTACRITATPGGNFLASAGVFLALFGWALTALFAAGFTRAIRQP